MNIDLCQVSLFTVITLLPSLPAQEKPTTATFETPTHRKVTLDRYGDDPTHPTLILLHGASGLAQPLYQQQAAFFAASGYNVLLPHYFDATRSTTPSDENYRLWAEAVQSLIASLNQSATPPRSIFLVGYSLGASVALAVGSQRGEHDQSIAAIADWYGSLPDTFFYQLRGMPPLLILHGERDHNIPVMNARQLIQLCAIRHLTCDSHIYPDQAHGFDSTATKDADQRTLAFFSRFQ